MSQGELPSGEEMAQIADDFLRTLRDQQAREAKLESRFTKTRRIFSFPSPEPEDITQEMYQEALGHLNEFTKNDYYYETFKQLCNPEIARIYQALRTVILFKSESNNSRGYRFSRISFPLPRGNQEVIVEYNANASGLIHIRRQDIFHKDRLNVSYMEVNLLPPTEYNLDHSDPSIPWVSWWKNNFHNGFTWDIGSEENNRDWHPKWFGPAYHKFDEPRDAEAGKYYSHLREGVGLVLNAVNFLNGSK